MNSFSLYQLLLIIGIIQGTVTAVLLFFSKQKNLSKKLLGISIAIFCLVSVRKLLGSLGVFDTGLLRYIPLGYELFLPPLVYLYVLSLIDSHFSLRKHFLWFFIPAIVYFFYDFILYLRVLPIEATYDKDLIANAHFYSPMNKIEDYLILALTILFLAFGKKRFNLYEKMLVDLNVYKSDPTHSWVKSIFRWMVVLAVILLINNILNHIEHFNSTHRIRWQIFNVFFSFSIYYLGFMGYKREDTPLYQKQKALKSRSKKINNDQIIALEQQLKHQLEKDKIYLEPNLSINNLAQDLGTTAENISFVVNKMFDQTFRDLINTYRVETAKTLLKDNTSKRSILDIALASGFNSQASFYRAFKKFTDMSPKAYMNLNKQ